MTSFNVPNSILKITEICSRINNVDLFAELLYSHGFRLVKKCVLTYTVILKKTKRSHDPSPITLRSQRVDSLSLKCFSHSLKTTLICLIVYGTHKNESIYLEAFALVITTAILHLLLQPILVTLSGFIVKNKKRKQPSTYYVISQIKRINIHWYL